MSDFNYTDFYKEQSVQTAYALKEASERFAKDPTEMNGVLLRRATRIWEDADAAARAMKSHDL